MFKSPIAATVDAPQDPGVLETRLRAPKFRQVRAAAGLTDGVPAAFRDRRDVRRRALSRQSAVFLTVLFIIPLYVCPSYDAHTPSIVSEVSLYITRVCSLVRCWDFISARRRRRGASVVRGTRRLPHPGPQCEFRFMPPPSPVTKRRRRLARGDGCGGASVKPLAFDGCPHSGP